MVEPQSDKVNHVVKEVVFPVGDITDPVTGRRCRGPVYIDKDERHFSKIQVDSEDSARFK